MSDLERDCVPSSSGDCPAATGQPQIQRVPTRDAVLGAGMPIRRALPARARRMVGAWCFLDHFGPIRLTGDGLRVGPHPHIGLQTFTWPIAGTILHRDSLGSEQLIRPGQVNLMTAGRGITHSEESPPDAAGDMHGAQLWIALPDAQRHIEPAFEHYPEVPVIRQGGFTVTVMAGEALGERAPARLYSPLVGLELFADDAARTRLPLRPEFEYAICVLEGQAQIADAQAAPGELLYLDRGRESLDLSAAPGARLLLLGGEPFAEKILIWWNFVARERAEILQAARDWERGRRFGPVHGYPGEPIPRPTLPWPA